ncbi:MAG: hypothetical protein ACPGLY_23080 [Rubripirellula sp.]
MMRATTMKRLALLLSLTLLTPTLPAAENGAAEKVATEKAATERGTAAGWRTKRIHEQFYAEGASAGDLDGDGNIDVVCGPIWFRGPEFKESFELAPPRQFPVAGYSDQFFSGTLDANQDGATDILVIGFPGAEARLYLNPGHDSLRRLVTGPTNSTDAEAENQHWPMHLIADIVDNESPAIVDLLGSELPELVCGREGQYGFYSAGDDVTQPWIWTPVTRAGAVPGRFTHGMGVGDVNGDGRLDLLDQNLWWEQPEQVKVGQHDTQQHWTEHRWADPYGSGGAQIRVADLDGDGDADIVTSLNAHAYGLAWFEQTNDSFIRHDIMRQTAKDSPVGVAFSQMHAVELVDMDDDGVHDIVTGKRWMAHGGNDPGGMEKPVLYWFRCIRGDDGIQFEPKLIDRDSGVGTDVLVTDLNADKKPDIVSCSKRGLSVHWQTNQATASQKSDSIRFLVGDYLQSEGGTWDPNTSPLQSPFGIDFDSRGAMYIIELSRGALHRYNANGSLKTLRSPHEKGYSGDGDIVGNASFNGPHNCVVAADDQLLISDSWNHGVRKVDLETLQTSTLAGTGQPGFSGDGGVAPAAMFNYVMCIALSADHKTLHLADLKNHRIRNVVLASGKVSTVAGNGQRGRPQDGSLATDAPLVDPRAVASDAKGNLYILERGGHALRVVKSDGTIHTLAGTGEKGFRDGEATQAQFGSPKHLCCDPSGNVYIADDQNRAIRKYAPKTGAVTTVLGRGHGDERVTLDRPHGVRWHDGALYVVDTGHNRILRLQLND